MVGPLKNCKIRIILLNDRRIRSKSTKKKLFQEISNDVFPKIWESTPFGLSAINVMFERGALW